MATEVNTQVHMPLFLPLLITLTLLLLLAAAPRNSPLETSAFTWPLTALTPKTQLLPPSRLSSSSRTPTPDVPSAGLHQVGYKIFAAATTKAPEIWCPPRDGRLLYGAGVCPATVVVGRPADLSHLM